LTAVPVASHTPTVRGLQDDEEGGPRLILSDVSNAVYLEGLLGPIQNPLYVPTNVRRSFRPCGTIQKVMQSVQLCSGFVKHQRLRCMNTTSTTRKPENAKCEATSHRQYNVARRNDSKNDYFLLVD
jgi:hypothetical protein